MDKKEYSRAYYAKNKERIQENRRKAAYRKALAEIESGKVKIVTRIEYDGQEAAAERR